MQATKTATVASLRPEKRGRGLDVAPNEGWLAVIGAAPYAMRRRQRQPVAGDFHARCGNRPPRLRSCARHDRRGVGAARGRPVRDDAGVQLLAFDTATPATTVALLLADGRVLTRRHEPASGERPGHVAELLPLALELLEEAGVPFARLDRLAVGIGPGTFTGLRIGVATARALAHAHALPLVGVSTLRSLAAGAHAGSEAATATLAVLDARRGEAFAAAWGPQTAEQAGGEPLLAPAALAPEALANAVAALPRGALAVGDGAVKFRDVLEAAGLLVPADGSAVHRVDAAVHARLAAGMEPDAPDTVLPAYLRLPDAELALRRRRATRS
jgi:tRNA threonylcarbamoyladenosine biosynthesis protein TsaB